MPVYRFQDGELEVKKIRRSALLAPTARMASPLAAQLQARRTLAYAALVFAAGQAALAVGIDGWLPELRDPIFGQKIGQLRQRLAGPHTANRLVVVLGSSRSVHGCDAAGYEACISAGGRPAAVYNFGIPGGGPLTELLTLRRLLRAGIRPDEVLVEVLPALLVDEAMRHEAAQYPAARLWLDELPLVERHGGAAHRFAGTCQWFLDFYLPAFAHRLPIKRRFWPDLLPRAGHEHLFAPFDPHGWAAIPDAVRTPDAYQRGLEVARQSYADRLGRLQVGPLARAAIDDLLALCRERQILATLIVLPEGPQFRQWYSATASAEVEGFLDELTNQEGVSLIDARQWCDEESFIDSHHLLARGATAFSRKLAEAKLHLAGRPKRSPQ